MNQDLVTFVSARLDEEAELARQCDGVDFVPGELAGLHPAVALHVALHDPARVLREVEAKRRVLTRHASSDWRRRNEDTQHHDGLDCEQHCDRQRGDSHSRLDHRDTHERPAASGFT